jgi:hypothetical protein
MFNKPLRVPIIKSFLELGPDRGQGGCQTFGGRYPIL